LDVRTVTRNLRQLSSAGVVPEVCRGVWWNPFGPPPPNPFALHAVIALDSYVSLLSGMWWHGVISQRPYVVTCVRWVGKSFACENEFGRYEFVRIPSRLVFGYYDVPDHFFRIAEPEKALLDYLFVARFIKKVKPRLVELDLEDLDAEKLRRYARRMGMARYLEETGLADATRWPEFAPTVM